jgi:hypothetical protein
MGKLRFVALSLAIAACGSDDRNGPADASIDAKVLPPDAKVWMDAPPGPTYDLACYGMTPGTTVGDPIVVNGVAGEADQSGSISGLMGITIDFFKVGAATSAKTVMSGANGAYTSGDITGGVAIDHIRGGLTGYRTTYVYLPQPIRETLAGTVPLPLVSPTTFNLVNMFAGPQMDDVNGALLVTVTDCNIGMPQLIDGATLHVQQNGQDVGEVFDVGQFIAQAAGTFFVLNVPDGETEVWATYDNKTFPTRTVGAFKQPTGTDTEGTISVVVVPPGPVY